MAHPSFGSNPGDYFYAHHLDDGAPGGVAWPKYDATTDPYTQLDDAVPTGAGLRTSQCDFWDKVFGR